MREIYGFFDKLYFTESVLRDVRFEGERLRIHISGLFLLAEHPLQDKGGGPYEGELVFEGVVDSRRTIIEYVGDARKPISFKPPHDLVDEITNSVLTTEALQEFGFEGYLESPSAWIDNWVVRARSFTLRV